MWGIWLFSRKCEEFDFFPENVRNQRKRYLDIALNACQISRAKLTWPNALIRCLWMRTMRNEQLTTERQRACVDLVDLANDQSCFSILCLRLSQSVQQSQFFQFRRFSLVYLTFHVWREIRFKLVVTKMPTPKADNGRTTKFNPKWLQNEQLKPWLKKSANGNGFCKACLKEIGINSRGISALMDHTHKEH